MFGSLSRIEGGQNESHVWLGSDCCGRGCVVCWWRRGSTKLLPSGQGPLLQARPGSLLRCSEDLLCSGSDLLCCRSVRQWLHRDGSGRQRWCHRSAEATG